ncbi:MAG TPA: LamG-like jellyroll fold domain-containing protein [Candidatus Acidoferrum sp.]|nr:LamG-like jellyroll fold domain-containing protein [Candidatus Acidoferrum sp.]
MNLSDNEILELSELCSALVDGRLTDAQRSRLTQWLAASEPARQYYVRAMGLSASLCSYASEMQVEAPDAAPADKIIRVGFGSWLGWLAAAACLAFMLYVPFHRPAPEPVTANLQPEEHVARLTGARDCRWSHPAPSTQPGSYLRKGEMLDLAAGLAEITFDSGAQVVLEGPASLCLNSAWDATLLRGALKANVPTEAMGFRVSNASVQVVDLGTVFTMVADGSGAADVLVLKGMVETSSHDSTGQRTIVLHENQSRHFAQSGISKVSDPAQKFAWVSQPVSLDHFAPSTRYVHWSFDEEGGDVLKADAFGAPLSAFDARLEAISDTVIATVRTDGRWHRALRFNGHHYAKAAFPGLSGNSPHTVSFWVKVPEDVQLSSAYAMVAWTAKGEKLGSHPVHIGWNRNPTEGTVGVLRTDYGGGFAVGATPLRDGRWHHIAVVFVPGEDPDAPVEVKQYVDGHFEGEGKPSPPGTEVSEKFREPGASTIGDTLWLGCRVGNNGPRRDRFRGEMDELCIADHALSPGQIVALMKDNRPAPTALAARNQ